MRQPNGCTAEQNYERTREKRRRLRKVCSVMGYTLEEVWLCDVQDMLNRRHKNFNREMKKFFDNSPNIGPIKPREGFSGGRTGKIFLKIILII